MEHKKINNLEEAKAHFSDSIDPVICVVDGKEVQANSMDEANKLYAETTGGEETTGSEKKPVKLKKEKLT